MKHSESIAKLAPALVAAQAELRAIGKDSVNPHFKNRYASLDAIIEDVRPTLAKHGLAIVQGATTPESDANSRVVGFTVETMLVHTSGEWMSSGIPMPLAKPDPQGAGGALTYGRRYSLGALLCLATEDDDDGNAASVNKRSGAARERGGPATAGTAGERTGAESTKAPVTTPARAAFVDQTKVMPFGKSKGTPLTDMKLDDLSGAVKWARENKPDVYKAFIDAAELILDEKSAVGV